MIQKERQQEEVGPKRMPMDALEENMAFPASPGEAYITNPYADIKLLTLEQAFDCVAFLMGPIQAAVKHGCQRS
jgi:hypothetical protein